MIVERNSRGTHSLSTAREINLNIQCAVRIIGVNFMSYLIARRFLYSSILLCLKERWSFSWKMRGESNNQRQKDIKCLSTKDEQCFILFCIYEARLHPRDLPGNFYSDQHRIYCEWSAWVLVIIILSSYFLFPMIFMPKNILFYNCLKEKLSEYVIMNTEWRFKNDKFPRTSKVKIKIFI